MSTELAATFINRESGARCRVTAVDEGYAYLIIESGDRITRYSMPIAEYDGLAGVPPERTFSRMWRPATVADMGAGEAPAAFRPPKAPVEAVEVVERVTIGGEMDGSPLP